MIQTGFTFSLCFCGENRLDHFLCNDAFVNEIVLFILSAFIIITTKTVILVSYAYIHSTVLKIPSTHGHSRTFCICSSHITVVNLFYGTVFFYAQAGAISSPEKNKIIAVFYILLSFLLNPLIYSLTKREVKNAAAGHCQKKYYGKDIDFYPSVKL